jgi:hypothetical protein
LGPLHQHRPRFLSAWDLTPTPTIYHLSRNIVATTPTSTSISEQHDEGACILNSCVFISSSSNWVHIQKLCNISLISFFPSFLSMRTYIEGFFIDYLFEQTTRIVSTYLQDNLKLSISNCISLLDKMNKLYMNMYNTVVNLRALQIFDILILLHRYAICICMLSKCQKKNLSFILDKCNNKK